MRSLVQSGHAGLRPKELLPGRERLLQKWMETSIDGRMGTLAVRAAGSQLEVSLRQALFLEADLQKVNA